MSLLLSLGQNQFEFSQHAVNQDIVNQSILRQISVQELREAIEQSEVIENYPGDKYSASCLGSSVEVVML